MKSLRWAVAIIAIATFVVLTLDHFSPNGPWKLLALLMAAITAIMVGVFAYAFRNYEQEMQEAAAIARRSEAERGEMQREADRRTQLEQQLRQVKQDAESAMMAKGEFLATMSHEIRTPLNGIVPMLDLLMHGKLTPDQAEMVHTAFMSSQQMLRIVDDILDYSKLEASKLQLESTTFNLREMLESVIQLMERPAQSKGLRLNLQIDPSVRLPVRGDPVRLRQILSNLISNSVKFTERGTVSVNVRKVGETAAQHQLRFEVRDTGIGISKASQERLFQAFSQADTSTTRLYGGTGLGLAISKRIIDLMSGMIGVESELGQGSLFWFEVPLLKVQGDITEPRPAETTDGRVLLLTNDQRLRLRLTMLLPNWGLRVTAVETTQEALERLRTAAIQGPPSAYSTVLADLGSVRNTAIALQRNLERQNIYGQVRLICLQGDEVAPEELLQSATLLQRQVPDADLRAALVGAHATPQKPQATAPAAQRLPERIPAATHAAGTTANASTTASASNPRPLRVLLVEDNPVNLMVGQRLLSVLGTHCDTANNGEAALLRISASRYDLVLMDCQMPVMDGYTATQRWREHEAATNAARRLPIVAMTANAMAGDRQKCLDSGMDDYLAKPVTRAELERCLFHWQQVSQSSHADGGQSHPPSPSGAQAHGAFAHADELATPSAAPSPSFATPPSASAPGSTTSVTPPPVITSTPSWVKSSDTQTSPHVPASGPYMSAPSPSPATDATVQVLDHSVLDELRSMLGSEVDRLIDVFLDDTPRLIAALETAAVANDFDMLRNAAHSLKSSSANLGAMALSNAAKKVELGARARSLERPAVAVALISNEFARARSALRANVSRSASQSG